MKKFFALVGTLNILKFKRNPLRDGFTPYVDEVCNRNYNLLFCDRVEFFRSELGSVPAGIWDALLDKKVSIGKLWEIAEDPRLPSRARLLAYHRLRHVKQAVRHKHLLGVVVETGSDAGLDVLAAYRDGTVECIDSGERIVRIDSDPLIAASVRALLEAGESVVVRIGPWLEPRIAPPTAGMVRMSFLVSDGLYFGQGWLDVMRNDELANPIITANDTLRHAVESAHALSS
jgi:hypothetical protein